MAIERTEIGGRATPGELDNRKYTGIAKVPAGRKWMLRRLIEATERAAVATDENEIACAQAEVARRELECRRAGITLKGKAHGEA